MGAVRAPEFSRAPLAVRLLRFRGIDRRHPLGARGAANEGWGRKGTQKTATSTQLDMNINLAPAYRRDDRNVRRGLEQVVWG